jgi:predicted house-cleaning noncanonical NTP pyrophosphatase (MazG superfamily)
MPTKLVRDRVPEIMRAAGLAPLTRIAPPEERLLWLLTKLREETAEVVDNPCIDECADVLEVVVAIAGALGYAEAQLRQVTAEKAAERGGFGGGILLELGGEDEK